MASRAHQQPEALDVALSALPSLPRPVLARLVTRLIDRLDEIDGDPDPEDDTEDRCLAGDDGVFSGAAVGGPYLGFPVEMNRYALGSDEDMEREVWPTFGAQSEPVQ